MTVTDVVADPGSDDPDGVLAALDGLTTAMEANLVDEELLAGRIDDLREGRAEGRTWYDLLTAEKRPGVLGLTSRIVGRFTAASGVLRRALTRALRLDGVTIAAIARLFSVSHQRVSALLRREDQPPTL